MKNGNKEKKFLLIGGSGRSGTTILSQAMAMHRDLSDVPEWRFATDPDGVIDFYNAASNGVNSPFHYDLRLKRLERMLLQLSSASFFKKCIGSAKFRGFNSKIFGVGMSTAYAGFQCDRYAPSFSVLVKDFIASLYDFSYDGYWVGAKAFDNLNIRFSEKDVLEIKACCRAFLLAVADDVCRNQGVKYHLEKNTWNILFFEKMLEIMPEARLVHIIRDPRDVVASYTQQPWVPDDYTQAAKVYASVMQGWKKSKKSIPEHTYKEIKLEELTGDPERYFKEICQFWGLEWDQKLMDVALSDSSFGRWKKDIPKEQLPSIEAILAPTLEKYGYV
tara:strand:- start:21392 stop:22387 length:996 start_codon:yes stop_codon:yes gene_type:complete